MRLNEVVPASNKRLKTLSKFLSLVLRHKPEIIGLALDRAGWVAIDQLVQHANARGMQLSSSLVLEVVATSDKKRFAISDDGLRIRASQGHSLDIELGLDEVDPPAELLHGTASRFLASIQREGLMKGSRQHVHLSDDQGVASAVGRRYGELVLLRIDAARMSADGHCFYRSANGVWLPDAVPPEYISVLPSQISALTPGRQIEERL